MTWNPILLTDSYQKHMQKCILTLNFKFQKPKVRILAQFIVQTFSFELADKAKSETYIN